MTNGHDDHRHRHSRYRSVLDAPKETWITLGPSSVQYKNGRTTGPCSGRTNWLELTPPSWQSHRYMYAGAVGGVWRSPDQFASYPFWEPLTDDLSAVAVPDRPGLQHVGCLALDRFNEGVMYAGTGDKNQFSSAGILKSTDAGTHWTLVGKSEFAGGFGITRMFVDPTDQSGKTVFAVGGRAAGRGIFMSTDFGATWQLRHGFPDPIVTPTQDLVDAQDLVWQIDTSGNLVLTAAIVVSQSMNPLVSLLSGFYRSTDKGATWSSMTFEYIVNAADGSDADQTWIGPTTMATGGVYDGDPIYAAVTGRFPIPNFGPEILNFFKFEPSTPIGPAWRPLLTKMPMVTQDGYDQALATARGGTTTYFGWRAEVVIQSWNSGKDWADLGYEKAPPGKQSVHSDHHCLLYATEDGGERVYSANDGGIFRFEYAADAWWSVSTFSLKNMQNNSATANPRDPRVIMADGQDNGMNVHDPVADRWGWPSGYDGTGDEFGLLRFAPDPVNDPEIVFWAGSEGGLSRSDDRGQHFYNIKPPAASAPTGESIVYAFHPTQHGRMVGGWLVPHETRDYGATWKPIAQPGQLPALPGAIAYGDPDTIYAAVGGSLFWTSNDSGNWSQLSAKQDFGGAITGIAVDKFAPIAVFMCTDGGKVWQTLDQGQTWTDITATLSAGPCHAITLLTESGKWTLFVATSVGVWTNEMPNGVLGTWVRFGTGLPDIEVMDLELNPFGRILTVATMGRGTWQATF